MRKIPLLVCLLATAFVSKAQNDEYRIPQSNSAATAEVVDLTGKSVGYSFNVYDANGPGSNYGYYWDGYLLFNLPEGTTLSLSGTVTTNGYGPNCEYLEVFDGATAEALKLTNVGGSSVVENVSLSCYSSNILFRFKTDGWDAEGVDITASIVANNVDASGFVLNSEQTVLYRYIGEGGDITIPSTVTEISTGAFQGCQNLTSVDFSEATLLTTIGSSAFQNSGLEEITIPDAVSSIGNDAFGGVKNLVYNGSAGTEAYTWGAAVRNGSFDENYIYSSANAIVKYTGEATDVVIPAKATAIGGEVFYNKSLTSVDFSQATGLTSIGSNAFESCGLEEITIPDYVTLIGSYAFTGIFNVIYNGTAEDVNSNNWGATVRNAKIDENYVLSSDGLTLIKYVGEGGSVAIPDTIKTIGDKAFRDCDALTAVTIPASVETISESAFYSCDNLVTVDFNNATSLQTIGTQAFKYCRKLRAVDFSNAANLTTIGSTAFCECGKMETLDLSGATSLQTIGSTAFWMCKSLTEVTIPAAVETIAASAFQECDKLASVSFASGSNLKNIYSYVFYKTALEEITLPNVTLEYVDGSAFSGLKNVIYNGSYGSESDTWGAEVRNGVIDGDYIYGNAAKTIIAKYIGSDSEIVIPASIEGIGKWAFGNNNDITSVDFSAAANLTNIEPCAFYSCDNITAVVIPASVQTIGSMAFYNCDKLAEVDLSGASNLETIGSLAFFDCNALTAVAIPASVKTIGENAFNSCDNLTVVDLSGADALTSIGEFAFNECYVLEEVVIPASVKTIGNNAFYKCYALTDLDLSGATSLKIIGAYAFSGCSNLIVSADIPTTADTIYEYAFSGFKNINYTGTASDDNGNNWGALTRNGYVENGLVFTTSAKTKLTGCLVRSGEVEIPASVDTICSNAFKGCNNVSAIIPAGVTNIASNAFDGVINIVNNSELNAEENSNWGAVNVSNVIDKEKGFVFADADSTILVGYIGTGGAIQIPSTVVEIGSNAFKGSAITSVDLSKATGLTTIGSYAFQNCKNLTEITIPATVSNIGYYTFDGCSNLNINCVEASYNVNWDGNWNPYYRPVKWMCEKWDLTDSVLTIKADVSYYYSDSYYPWYSQRSAIKSIVFTSNVTTVDQYEISNCYNLESIDFSEAENLTTINTYAFYNCDKLDRVVIPASVENMGSYVFSESDNVKILCEAESRPDGWSSDWDYHTGNNYWGSGYVGWDCTNWSLSDDGHMVVGKDYNYNNNESYPWYNVRSLITSVEFADGITTINTSEFYDCNNLTEVRIPAAVTAIGDVAFYSCDNLAKVLMAEGSALTSIGVNAFGENHKLTDIDLTKATDLNTIGESAFYECNKMVLLDVPESVFSIGSSAFYHIRNINYDGVAGTATETWGAYARNGIVDGDFLFADAAKTKLVGYLGEGGNVTIPSTVKSIGESTFANCTGLTAVSILSSVTTIEKKAFYNCQNLKSVNFSEGVNYIGSEAFYNCDSLKTVTLPSTLETLGYSAFQNCEKLESVDMSQASLLTQINSSTFSNCDSLKTVTLPENVKYIEGNAFYDCDALTTIAIPSKVKYINSSAFYGCDKLESVDLSEATSLQYIYSQAFEYCANLKTIDLASARNLGYIDSYAFRYCSALKSVTIPAKVTSINYESFLGCAALETVDFSQATSLTSIGSESFNECDALESIDMSQTKVSSINDYAFGSCPKLTTVKVPETIAYVSSNAFSNSSNIQYTVEGGLSYLGNDENPNVLVVKANSTDMSTASLSSNTKAIARNAFSNCNNWPTEEGGAYYIGDSVNPHLMLAKATSTGISECDIVDSTRFIGEYAFYNCSGLGEVLIPESVVGVGYYAFGSTNSSIVINCEATNQPAGWNSNWNPSGCMVNWAYGSWSIDDNGVLTISKCISFPNYNDYPWYSKASSITKVVFEEGVSCVGKNAFHNGNGNYYNLREVVLPSTMESIADYAFYGCYNIDTVNIDGAENLTSIGESAFYNCYSMKCEADFGKATGLATIGSFAFYNCDQLNKLVVPASVETIDVQAFYDCEGLTTVDLSQATGLTTINAGAFYGCYNIDTVDFSNLTSLKTIGYEAFRNCNSMKGEADFSNATGLTSIGYYAFCNSDQLTTFVAPASLRTIEYNAFYSCDNLVSVTIPSSVTEIGNEVFHYCSNLQYNELGGLRYLGNTENPYLYLAGGANPDQTEFSINSNTRFIGSYALNDWSGITEVVIPESVTAIGSYAFNGCSRINNLEVPATVETIGDWAFQYVRNIVYNGSAGDETSTWGAYTRNGLVDDEFIFADNSRKTILKYIGKGGDVVIPASVETIGTSAFYTNYRNNIASVDFSLATGLKSIGESAFNDCDGLTEIVIPASVETIGSTAFNDCDGLAEIDLSNAASLTAIGYQAFYNCNALTEIVIPATVKAIGNKAFQYCASLAEVDLSGADALASIGEYAFNECYALEEIAIPAAVKSIGSYAFYNNANLTAIDLSGADALTAIGEYAFASCSKMLAPVSVPASVSSIGQDAFRYFKNISYSGSAADNYGNNWGALTLNGTIDGNFVYADAEKTNLTGYTAYSGNIEIPEGVETIGTKAFKGCNYVSATIPSTVTYVATDAFVEIINVKNLSSYETYAPWGAYNYNGLVDENGFILSEDGTLLISYLGEGGAIQIPASVVEIKYDAFKNNTTITSVDLSAATGLSTIGSYAFQGCSALTDITIPETVTTVGYYAFNGCNSLNINCEAASQPWNWDGNWNPNWRPVKWFCNGWDLSADGVLTLKANISFSNGENYPWYSQRSNIKNIEFADGVTSIGNHAFYDCDYLGIVVIPAQIESMGSSVFYECSNVKMLCEAESCPSDWNYDWDYYTGYNYWGHGCVGWDYANWKIDANGHMTVLKDYSYDDNDKYPWYKFRSQIKSVGFGDDVKVVGNYAFFDCDNLTEVELPALAENIGSQAFYDCDALTEVQIPAAVETIGNSAFYNCDNLATVDFTFAEVLKKIDQSAFQECYKLTDVNLADAENLTTVGYQAFYNCYRMQSLDVPSSVTSIGDNAFYNVKNINYNGSAGSTTSTWGALSRNGFVDGDFIFSDAGKTYLVAYIGKGGNVTIPSTVTTIGAYAFRNCAELKSVTIPEGVSIIKGNAFYNCDGLTSVTLPSTVMEMYSSVFSDCDNLVSADFSKAKGLTYINNSTFQNCYSLANVKLPENIEYIYSNAFYNCGALESFVVPATVQAISEYAFAYCDNLKTVDLSNATSLTSISYNTFYDCEALTSVVIPENVTSIGSEAFAYCYALESVDLSKAKSLTTINSSAFYDCDALKSIDLSKATSLKTISSSAFYDCDALESIDLSNTQVTTIYGYAFYSCDNLTSVKVPSTLKVVRDYVFSDCNSLQFNETEHFNYLGNSANPYVLLVSAKTTDMSEVEVESGVKVLAMNAFSGCSNFATEANGAYFVGNAANPYMILVKVTSTYITESAATESTRFIADYAFSDCYSLSSVNIPESVEGIGYYAFGYTNSYLEINCEVCLPQAGWDENWNPNGRNVNWAVGGWAFDSETGILTVNKCIEMSDYSSYPWISMYNSIRTVVFGEGASCVGQYAFYNGYGHYSNLRKVVISSTVESIGYRAFDYCYYIDTLDLSSATGLTTIGYEAFRESTGLDTIDFSNATSLTSIGSYAFYNCYNMRGAVDLSNATSLETIGDYAFYNCDYLTEAVLPEELKTIGSYAFNNCDRLASVSIPSSIQTIGDNTFSNCYNLQYTDDEDFTLRYLGNSENPYLYLAKRTGIIGTNSDFNINSGTRFIGDNVFYGISGYKVNIPERVESIGSSAFADTYIKNLDVPVTVKTIGGNAFGGVKNINYNGPAGTKTETWGAMARNAEIEGDFVFADAAHTILAAYIGDGGRVEIPSTVKTINDNVFYDYDDVTEVILPVGVTTIGDYAFYDCDGLTSIIIPENVTSIGSYAFESCDNLKTVDMSNATSLTTIGSYAFEYCDALDSVVIPVSVRTISSYAFYDCDGLKTLTISEGVTSIDEYAFCHCDGLTSIIIPENVTTIGSGAFESCRNLKTVDMNNAASLTTISSYAFRYCYALDSVVIPASVRTIGSNAFYDCDGLKWVNIPENCASIGNSAFYSCNNLETVDFSNATSLTNICDRAFDYCYNLKTADLSNVVNLTQIEDYAFCYCYKLESVVIPAKVSYIGRCAFQDCDSLTTVYIPKSVTSLGSYSFQNCDKLETVFLPASVTYVYTQVFQNCNNATIYTDLADEYSLPSNWNSSWNYSGCPVVWNCKIVEGAKTKMGKVTVEGENYLATGSDNRFWYLPDNTEGTATLTAVAAENYHFQSWKHNGSTENPLTVTVTESAVFEAEFVGNTCVVTTLAENGTVNGGGEYSYNTSATLKAVADEHYHFAGWADGFAKSARKVKVLGDTTFTALFDIDQHSVVADVENGGSVSGTGSYAYGSQATIEAVPAYGYHFTQWSDGNTNNPRTIDVLSDTSFTAQTATNNYTVSVVAENGSVTGAGSFNYLSKATLIASADAHYHFAGWADGYEKVKRTVDVLSDTTFTALFEIDQHNIAATADNGGSVTGTGKHAYGSQATLTVVPATGYHFKAWADNATAGATRTVDVLGDASYSALTEINVYAVTASATNGSVTNLGNYEHGQEVEFEAVPASGYKFARWTTTNTNPKYKVTVTSDMNLTPVFIATSESIYTIAVSATDGGSVSGAGAFLKGEKATLTATANEGYRFLKWSDGVTTASRDVSVSSNAEFKAEFKINSYDVTVLAGANGTVKGGGSFDFGATTEISATAAAGYHFAKWSDGNTEATRTVTVNNDLTFTAEFAINTYAVKASATNGAVEGAGTYNHGAEATLTAVANTGYHFSKWSDGVTTATRKATVTSALEFTAEFEINSYAVTVSAENGTVEGAGTYNHGASATLTATAAEGYHFAQWSDGDKKASRKVTVTSDTAFAAEFEVNTYAVKTSATNGTVEGAGTYNYGAEATLTATAAEGYHFAQWNDGVTESTRKVTVKDNMSFTAQFAINTYTVTVDTAVANGKLSGAGVYEYGEEATLKATANTGYHFVQWTDSVKTATRNVTVTADATFSAEFAINTYELKTTAKNGTVEGAGVYEYGAEVTLTATPAAGYQFVKWSDGSKENPRKVTVTAENTYTASFKQETYTVSVEAENGTIYGSTGTFTLGAVVTLTAEADNGYHFVKWSDGNTENPRTITLTADVLKAAVQGDVKFTAIFEKDAPSTAVGDETAEAVTIFAFGNTIVVENAESEISIYNAMGVLISKVQPNADRTEITVENGAGVYIVKSGNATQRVMIND